MKNYFILLLIFLSTTLLSDDTNHVRINFTPTNLKFNPHGKNTSFSQNEPPDVPQLLSLFDNAAIYTKTPTLLFLSLDPEGDDIEYRIYWDADSTFSTPDSHTTSLHPSGDTVNFTFSSSLSDRETFFWKVKARDPDGSNSWSAFSEKRSFTINTSLSTGTVSWFQQKGVQFGQNIFSGTEVKGDSIKLVQTSVKDTLISEGFEGAFPPSDWEVFEVGASNNYWFQAGDYAHSGSYSAKATWDDSEVDTWLVTEAIDLSPYPSCSLSYYQMGFWTTSYYQYWGLWVSTTSQTDTSAFTEIQEVGPGPELSWEKKLIDLTSYCGEDTVYLAFRYKEASGTDWWVDDVNIIVPSSEPLDSGKATSIPVAFNWLTDYGYTRFNLGWADINWKKSESSDSIGIHVEYLENGSWSIIPDSDLPGNTSGFFRNTTLCTLQIDTLDTGIYDTLRVVGKFYTSGNKASTDPALLFWDIGHIDLSGIKENKEILPQILTLHKIKPNPFHSKGIIEYALPEETAVNLSVYDISGRNVITLVDGIKSRGYHSFRWDGRGKRGKKLTSGVYFIRLTANDKTLTRKAVILK